ncbi:DEAD/DEAH box helicase [Rossellomorea aquimaris]|uniref:DEAD/DEAH box helicase n=1 Tax=Rossellomorea aquimaris TaxID=189382 RepID=A0A5D4UL67_9BACI|nr:DEAD/DEAH box helicase family protein [Rossellomorea aquimaris]TYS81723.1 DEAD/DEAH box helicase [Rossellomorea aquimaris]TYS88347.1 DEAD/DEAH box helicase [Rossellomorea aquimaris]
MSGFLTENEIEQTVESLINVYKIDRNLLIKFIGTDKYIKLNRMLMDLEVGAMDDYQLARMIVVEKGLFLFAGSNDVVRDLRALLLKQLEGEQLVRLYERNPISNRKIKSPSYMPKALAGKRWVMGGRWAREFVQTLGFPLAFSGISIPKDHSTDPVQDIEPRKSVPPLVEYQQGLKEKMLSVLNKEQEKTRCVVTLPTGGGKTRVAVESFIDWMQPRFNEGKYLLWIAQGEELCEQAISCITEMWQEREFPESLRVYRYFGGKTVKYESLIGGAAISSIQQLYSRIQSDDEALNEILANCGAMIIDEAHHATTKSYEVLFNKCKELAGVNLFPICGLTATPGRSNEETMTLVNQFEAYLIHPSLPDMRRYELNPLLYFREEGYLAEPIFLLHENGEEIEVSEYIEDEHDDLSKEFLNDLANNEKRNFQIIEYMESIPLDSSSLVYACTVEHAEFLAMIMNSIGRKSAAISADTPKPIRRMHIAAFKQGDIEFLFNYGVLTTGFDAPKTDHILICRPTSSIILYEQMVGRGLRGEKFGGTEYCKIVDFSKNIKRHGEPLAYARFINDWQIREIHNIDEISPLK